MCTHLSICVTIICFPQVLGCAATAATAVAESRVGEQSLREYDVVTDAWDPVLKDRTSFWYRWDFYDTPVSRAPSLSVFLSVSRSPSLTCGPVHTPPPPFFAWPSWWPAPPLWPCRGCLTHLLPLLCTHASAWDGPCVPSCAVGPQEARYHSHISV